MKEGHREIVTGADEVKRNWNEYFKEQMNVFDRMADAEYLG